jgi:hypothetical protein
VVLLATHSRLPPPMIDAARTVKRHWNGILVCSKQQDR